MFNEWYCRDTSKKIRAVMKSKGETGERLCTNPPYGYMKEVDTWERVQELRKNKRRPTRTGKTNLFSGIVRCADCGEKLYYCTSKNFEARQDHFVCFTSRLKGKEVCPTHFIRTVVLEQGVLAHMRLVIVCVSTHEERFRAAIGAKQKAEVKKELAAKRRQLTQAERCIEELDRQFKRIYEDNANGKLSDSRLTFPMTLWEYSPPPCFTTYQRSKRHSQTYAVFRKQLFAVL